MDEPFSKAMGHGFGTPACPQPTQEALARDVAGFMSRVRRVFPRAQFGVIESCPLAGSSWGFAELRQWILTLAAAAAREGVRLSWVELDNAAVPAQLPKTKPWPDVIEFERWVKARGLGFSMIFMSQEGLTEKEPPGAGLWADRPPATDQEWGSTLRQAVSGYRRAGGHADLYMVQSWHAVPAQGLPEQRPNSFMGTVLEAFRRLRTP